MSSSQIDMLICTIVELVQQLHLLDTVTLHDEIFKKRMSEMYIITIDITSLAYLI